MIDNNKVVQELNKMKCDVHGKNAEASIVNGQISVSTCCDTFHEKIEKAIDAVVSKQINDSINKAFNG